MRKSKREIEKIVEQLGDTTSSGGRPVVPEEKQRDVRAMLQFRRERRLALSDDEQAELLQAAYESGVAPGEVDETALEAAAERLGLAGRAGQ